MAQGTSPQTSRLLAEKKRRDEDTLRLYRPFPYQLPAITTKASEVLIRGGNRSAKSITAAAIVSAAARGLQLTGPDGKPLPPFCPLGRPLTIWVIGKGEAHISDTLHRLLFQKGQLPLFKDKKTGLVRAAKTWEERAAGVEQKLVSEPFIPEWEVKGGSYDTAIAWKDKKANFFSSCEMLNGTTIHAFTSSGDVKMGDPVDLIWIDEDIEYPKYVAEWEARLSDRKGRILWSAWPHASNYALVRMSQNAAKQKDRANPDFFEMRLSFADNPLIDPDEKRKRYEAWSESGSEELRSRVDGEFSIGLSLMYPNFSADIHGIPRGRNIGHDHVGEAVMKNGGLPPRDWTRYMSFDPGHAYAAFVFFAIPPASEFGDAAVLYDELYLQAHDADQAAKKVREKVAGLVFQDFIIDSHFAKQSVAGLGKTHGDIYSEVFARLGIRSVASGSGFTMSNSAVESGCEQVRTWLSMRDDGTTKLRVVVPRVPNWVSEIQMYKKYLVRDEAKDKPAGGQKDHLMDATRYLIMANPEYVPVPDLMKFMPDDPVMLAFKTHHQRQGQKPQTPLTVHCGVGAIAGAA